MGYCWGPGGIVCDGCGRGGGSSAGVRKRKCPHGWCPPPALCAACYKAEGGLRGVHGDACKEAAAEYAAKQRADQAKLDAGDMKPAAAWGSWQEGVPEGMVGVLYRGNDCAAYYLLPQELYVLPDDAWFSKVAHRAESWEDNPQVMSKRVAQAV